MLTQILNVSPELVRKKELYYDGLLSTKPKFPITRKTLVIFWIKSKMKIKRLNKIFDHIVMKSVYVRRPIGCSKLTGCVHLSKNCRG